ncbi:family 1 glycosylhydrolase [Ramlibacter tataouinensis]|uniref:dTDP-4-dehydrorhamnose reductase n=1 Tax=Ramlibacter tataouinensis (strain ATCC BAA-407 / DSM 14655 / LMG 21543 / TTB310) TaxID=365046 RepID=F5XVK5_RAMTT|nr:family 1 glycosylhydrolase [Ramlibacter tataouinensis]AEG91581.1 candidate b-glycosidase, Glycoside Hydrolase Family 1 [Ramlibacter tataouinensis TTB310]
MTGRRTTPLQLWAGPECTVNRVGDRFFDQIERNGFAHRLDDLDRLAGLGVRRIRFPLLWERTAPGALEDADWRWADQRMARMADLGVAPIVGLLHHGSGPRHTHLLDPDFPRLLAAYACAVAQRYPQVDAWTPVNEPLTTARFAGLYGHWYPHGRDDAAFVRALLGEIQGTVAAMRAVREVNPRAQLVQTDDLGFTTCNSPRLQYQADFENVRRWLSFDLLCGKVDRGHPLWGYLVRNGASEEELLALVQAPCPPDLLGINAYVTSERFLDDRLERYPEALHGGNGRDRYVDVETLRIHGAHLGGFRARLREAWERYRLPMAVTEVHLGCSREEQLRWLHQTWACAQALREEGLDLRAVTVWAAFGTYDWDSLVTRDAGHYEPGLWDVSAGPAADGTPATPRPTALARLARQLAAGQAPDSPVLAGPGWWQRELRLAYPCHGELQALPVTGRPLLITGATGTLGRAYARLCELRGLPYRLLSRAEMDIGDPASVEAALERWQPWAVVNTAGFVRVDDAEHEPRHWRDNVHGPAVLAAACARRGVRHMGFSSDLVFDGRKGSAYVESDVPAPLNAYGRSKLEAERRMLVQDPAALVIRTAAFFGPWDRHNFVTLALEALQRGEPWRAASDQFVSPTYVPDLVQASLDLLIDGERGIWHLANRGAVSWAGFAQLAAQAAGLPTGLVQPCPGAELGQVAPRPRYAPLASERGQLMPALESGLERYLSALASSQTLAEPARTLGCTDEPPLLDALSRSTAETA